MNGKTALFDNFWEPTLRLFVSVVFLTGIFATNNVRGKTDEIADIIESAHHAVVQIRVNDSPKQLSRYSERSNPLSNYFTSPPGFTFSEKPYRQFQSRNTQRVGSGFLIDRNGVIVTNAHVVARAANITVSLPDGLSVKAKLLGIDPISDLAVIQIEGDDFPYISFDNSENVRVGDQIIAIGNPFGLTGSATSGIVSGKNRDLRMGSYDNYLQIDAPINSGNSGGPVLNMRGDVVAVSTAIYSPNGGNIGIGFAIPASDASKIVDALVNNGHVARGYLGLQTQAISKELANTLGLENTNGALVTRVQKKSSAHNGGIKVGDVIFAFDEILIDTPSTLARVVSLANPNSTKTIGLISNGKRRNLIIKLTTRDSASYPVSEKLGAKSTGKQYGLILSNLTSSLRSNLNLSADAAGVVITRITAAGPAAEAGLYSGDLIVTIDKQPVRKVNQAYRLLSKSKNSDQAILILLRRGGNQFFVSLNNVG